MGKYILAFDQGTTSSRSIIFDHAGAIIGTAQREFEQLFPEPGWVEHDPEAIWRTQIATAGEVLGATGTASSDIDAIGITNQRETTVVWDRKTCKPVYNAIVWQDRRTSGFCDQLAADGLAETIRQKTGLVIDAYFSGTKVRWILDNVPGAREKADKGELAFGTIDSWLIYRLTAGKLHITDATNASRTMLYNIHTLQWDDEMLNILGVPASMLPEVRGCSEVYAETSGENLGGPIRIAGIAGDQQAALFGNMSLEPGSVKTTYGTGCFMLLNTGTTPIDSNNKLLTTVACQVAGTTTYALEGSVFIGGATVQWLRDGLKIIKNSSDVEALAMEVEDTGGVYLVPAFAGLGAPNWDQYARGIIVGITRGTTSAHIARAALEGIAFQVADVLEAMRKDYGKPITAMRVDGGASANNLLMQFEADIIRCPVVRPKVTETTALGAAYLAGLAVGFWESHEQIQKQWAVDRTFETSLDEADAMKRLSRWNEAVSRAGEWQER